MASSNAHADGAFASASAVATLEETPLPRSAVAALATDCDFSSVLVAHHDRTGSITEQYRALRTQLLAKFRDGQFCVMLTSSDSGEGKTVTCLNLAIVMAARGQARIVVVDCDMRKGSVARLLGMNNSPGLAERLSGVATTEQIVRSTPYPNLFVVPAGKPDHNACELMGGQEYESFMKELKRQFDCVLIDSPPVNVVADASVAGRVADEALLVVRMDRTRRESVDKAVNTLRAVKIKLGGTVLTHQKYHIPNCLYRYC
jgi:capsular exopolysaccharide synthesis family protein